MLRYFLKTPPLKYYNSKKDFVFIIKNTKKATTSASAWWGNTKWMLELFLNVSPLKKVLEFQNQKKDFEICTKRKFRTKNQIND